SATGATARQVALEVTPTTASTFSSRARRRNSVTCLSGPPASSTITSFTLTPLIPPSLFHLSTSHSAVFFPDAPNSTAGPERKSPTPIFSSAGAPAGGAALTGAKTIQVPTASVSAPTATRTHNLEL